MTQRDGAAFVSLILVLLAPEVVSSVVAKRAEIVPEFLENSSLMPGLYLYLEGNSCLFCRSI
jgi:hypothetical protein